MALDPTVAVVAPGELITADHLNDIRANLERLTDDVDAISLRLAWSSDVGSDQTATTAAWTTIGGTAPAALALSTARKYRLHASAFLEGTTGAYAALAVRTITSGVDLFHGRVGFETGHYTTDVVWTPPTTASYNLTAVFAVYFPASGATVTHRASIQPAMINVYDVGAA